MNPIKIENANTKPYVIVSHHSSSTEVNLVVEQLKSLFDVEFIQEDENFQGDNENNYEIFLVFTCMKYNEQNSFGPKLKDAFNENKNVAIINLESRLSLFNINKDFEKFDAFNFFKDTQKTYLNGEGKPFSNLVFWLNDKLPKNTIKRIKPTDLLIISPRNYEKWLKKLDLKGEVKYSYPSDKFCPNFRLIKDAKVVLAVINDEINECDKSIEEIKFANEIGTPIYVIEDTDIDYLDPELKSILRKLKNECQFQGIDKLDQKKYNRTISMTVKEEIDRKTRENDLKINLIELEKVCKHFFF